MSALRFIMAMACVAVGTGWGDEVAGIGDAESPTLTTDRASYVAVCVDAGSSCHRYAFPVVATYANPTEDTVYLGRDLNNLLRPSFFVVTEDARSGSGVSGQVGARPSFSSNRLPSSAGTAEAFGPTGAGGAGPREDGHGLIRRCDA